MERLEPILGGLPFLAPLRPDELCRAARRWRTVDLAPGESLPFSECLVVVSGRVAVEATLLEGQPPVRSVLRRGDHVGVLALLAGRPAPSSVQAERTSRIALLDAASYGAIADEFPIVAIPACAVLAQELAWKDELLRDVASIRTGSLGAEEHRAALEARRRRVASRLAGRGTSLAGHLRRLAGERLRIWVREPAFWMLAGLLGAFFGARVLVHWIFTHHAEHRLFALHHITEFDNPIHIHHFNYGLVLVTVTSLLAFFPAMRQHLRILGLAFGFGAGLILDEFGLIWNLDPNYYQWLSRIAVAGAALVLAQFAFLRDAWTRKIRRFTRRGDPV